MDGASFMFVFVKFDTKVAIFKNESFLVFLSAWPDQVKWQNLAKNNSWSGSERERERHCTNYKNTNCLAFSLKTHQVLAPRKEEEEEKQFYVVACLSALFPQ